MLLAIITVAPKVLTLEMHGRTLGKVTASAPSRNLNAQSTCYTSAGSPKDVLVVTGIKTQAGATSYSYAMDVRAQHVGKCTITFTSDRNTATVKVDVQP